jgi:hypothetical protein
VNPIGAVLALARAIGGAVSLGREALGVLQRWRADAKKPPPSALSHRDIEHQQGQIRASTRDFSGDRAPSPKPQPDSDLPASSRRRKAP